MSELDQRSQHEFTAIKQAWNRWAAFAHEHGIEIEKYGDDGYAVPSLRRRLREIKGEETPPLIDVANAGAEAVEILGRAHKMVADYGDDPQKLALLIAVAISGERYKAATR